MNTEKVGEKMEKNIEKLESCNTQVAGKTNKNIEKPFNQKTAKSEITRCLKSLGIYKKEFNRAILILSKMLADLYEAENKFAESGGEFVIENTNKAGATNISKNPQYQVVENLRSECISVMHELGLTPQGLKRYDDKLIAQEKKAESSLEKVLKMYG